MYNHFLSLLFEQRQALGPRSPGTARGLIYVAWPARIVSHTRCRQQPRRETDDLHPAPSESPGPNVPESGPPAGRSESAAFCALRDKTRPRPAASPMKTTRITARSIHSWRRVRQSKAVRDRAADATTDLGCSDFSTSFEGTGREDGGLDIGGDPKPSGDVRTSSVTTSGSGDSTKGRLVTDDLYGEYRGDSGDGARRGECRGECE